MSLGCVIDEMHAYPRHNIVIKEGFFTQQSCADFAASTHGAFFWTWMKSTKRCFVKNFDAIKNKTPNPDFVSGNTHCGTKGSRVPRVWPGGPWPRPRPGGLRPSPTDWRASCECINPFRGTRNHYRLNNCLFLPFLLFLRRHHFCCP